MPLRTSSTNPHFISLVKLLDKELAIRDGDDHAFYDQFNKIDKIKYVVLIYENDQAVSCGAIKEYDTETMEVKRMYTTEESRGQGHASLILKELEAWTKELGYKKCILETGINQHEALGLYKKNDYNLIPNYGQYTDVDTSLCFEKKV